MMTKRKKEKSWVNFLYLKYICQPLLVIYLYLDKTNAEETEALKTTDDTVQVIFNLNLKVEPGQLIGIAGAVGSGKSSLISGKSPEF